MAERLPSLNALRAFEAAARHGSLGRAAEELHVTTAAVSQQIKALEADLGAPLMRRSNGAWQLTAAGAAGLAELRQGFDHLHEAARRMRLEGRQRRRLTVSVVPSLAATWLVRRLDRFKQAHPDLDLLLDATTSVADLARGDADMAIRYGAGAFPDLHGVRLFEDEMFPVCSPRLLDGPHPLREPRDLAHHTLLHLEWAPAKGEWPDWRAWLLAAGVTGVDPDRGPRFTQDSMVLQAALEGQGVALGTTSHVVDDLAAGRLVWPFDLCMPVRFAYWVVAPRDRAERPDIAAFRAWLIAEAGHSLAGTESVN